MKAKSIYGNSPEQIKKALELAMADHFKPTLAIAFISIKQDRHGSVKSLNKKVYMYLAPPPAENLRNLTKAKENR